MLPEAFQLRQNSQILPRSCHVAYVQRHQQSTKTSWGPSTVMHGAHVPTLMAFGNGSDTSHL